MNLLLSNEYDLAEVLSLCLRTFRQQVTQFRYEAERWRQTQCLAEWYQCFVCIESPFSVLKPVLEKALTEERSVEDCFGWWCCFVFMCEVFVNTEEEKQKEWCALLDSALPSLFIHDRLHSELCCAEGVKGVVLAVESVMDIVRVRPTPPEQHASLTVLQGACSKPLFSSLLLRFLYSFSLDVSLDASLDASLNASLNSSGVIHDQMSPLSLLSLCQYNPFGFETVQDVSSFLLLQLQLRVFQEEREQEEEAFHPIDVQWFVSLCGNPDSIPDVFCKVVIPALNSITEQYPSLYLITMNDCTSDTWCDSLSDDWSRVFALRFKATPSSENNPLVHSFTLSSPSRSVDDTWSTTPFLMPSSSLLSFLTSLLFADCRSASDSFERLSGVVSLLKKKTDEQNTGDVPSSFLSYSLLIALLANCWTLHSASCVDRFDTGDWLSIASSLAPLPSLPSFILYPFLLPLYSSAPSFNELAPITQYCLLRCLPLLSRHGSPLLRSPFTQLCWSRRQQILYYFCQSNGVSSSVSFFSFIRALPLYCARPAMQSKENTAEMAQRVTKNSTLTQKLLLFILTHLASCQESVYETLLGLVRNVAVRAESLFLACMFPPGGAHYCCEATGRIHVLCSFDSVTFLRMVTQSDETLSLFLKDVLCSVHNCSEPCPTLRCECGECQQSIHEESAVLRNYVTRLQERLVQYLRLLVKEPAMKNHPFLPLLRSHFVLWVCLLRTMKRVQQTRRITCKSR